MAQVEISTHGVSFSEIIAIARDNATVVISPAAKSAMQKSRDHVEGLAASETPVYGISTGFGALANRHVSQELRTQLQRSLIRSHAAGVGEPVEREVVRALMALRLKTLASGKTGVRPVVAETMAALLNAGVTPLVREFGSLGCSGDLAPLAHCALVLMGEGEAADKDDVIRPVPDILRDAGITPIQLAEKEGLALINGTDGMLGMLILALKDLRELVDAADVVAAMSVEGLLGTDRVFIPELHTPLRSHPGQAISAARMLKALANSGIVASHLHNDDRVQDAYSLRCAPQVAGAVRDTIDYAATVAERELAAVIDNPVVLDDGRISSNGNFHGAPLGYVLDFLAIAVADLGSIAERRTDRALDKNRNAGLPPFLAADPGVDSGLMIAQYTQAALVSENKRLASPASVDSIPSSAMQEDHVSMGWSAARKLRKAITNLSHIIAIELVTAARAIELRAPLQPSPISKKIIEDLRKYVGGAGPDRYLSPELRAAQEFVISGKVTSALQ